MKVVRIGQDYAISAGREFLTLLRDMPDRAWDPKTGLWKASFTVENYDYMASLKWPIGHLEKPSKSMHRIDAVTISANTFFCVYGPANGTFTNKFKTCPEHNMFSARHKAWAVMPTLKSVAFLRESFALAQWSAAANEVVVKLESALERSQRLREAKTELAKVITTETFDFKFKTTPHEKQALGFMLSRSEEAFALLMEQGTGKTKIAIDTVAWLRSQGKIEALLVICPNDVKDVWVEELQTHMPEWCEYEAIIDGHAKPLDVDRFIGVANPKKVKVLITNVQALSSPNRAAKFAMFLAKYRAMMVLDEATRFKNPTAKRTKAMLKLGKMATYRRILTGTPVTQNPLDVYAPFRFLDPYILGFSSYAVMKQHHGIFGGWQNKQIVGFVKVEEIKEKIAPFSFRVLRDECMDLPPKVYQKHTIDLNPEQRRVYDEVRDLLISDLEQGGRVSSAHSLTKILRLSQIVGGFVKTDAVVPEGLEPDSVEWNEAIAAQSGRAPVRIEGPNPKLDTVLEIIEDLPADGKVVIWARFRAEIESIAESLAEIYGPESVVTFYGGVDRAERTERRHRFQGAPDKPHDPKCRFFIAQNDTGSVGLTLTRATTVIYYSNSYSLETRLQSEDRTHRLGQKGTVVYHDLVARNTIDVVLIQCLRRKMGFANLITGDAWRKWL